MLHLLDTPPTLIECVRFRGREKRINIPQEIGVKYHNFGLLLLEDDTGARIHAIAHEHRDNAEQINTKVLQQWINGRGKQPVTWKTLIEVLHDIELSRLAGEIEAVKCDMDISTEHISKDSAQKDKDEKRCETSGELQLDIGLLAADLLARYYENQSRDASHGVTDSLQSLRNITAEVSKDSDQGSNGDTPACGIQDDRYYEAIQQIIDIASEIPTRCSELLEAFKQKDHSSGNYPSIQRCQQDMIAEVSIDSELEHIPTSGIQQIVDIAADLLSRCFELEALNLKWEESQRSNATSDGQSGMTAEGAEHRNAYIPVFANDMERTVNEIADVAADLLSRCFELLDFEVPNNESGRNSGPSGVSEVSEDFPVLRALASETVKVSEQGSIENVPASCTNLTEDPKCHEALQHIADIAADLLYRCFVLLDFLALQKKQINLPHEIGDRQLSSQMKS